MFEDFAMTAKIARWEAITARKNALRAQAQAAGQAAYHSAFAQRSREMGGYNQRTAEHIREQANEAKREAKQAIYFAAGYTLCSGIVRTFEGDTSDCKALVSPGFSQCPDCTPLD